jgi:RNA polymerase sigma-70 factor (ECF subfamily)
VQSPPAVEETIGERRWRLILPHRERLRGLVSRRLWNTSDVEDCVQETLLRAATFAKLDEQRVGAFLTSTALRLCVDEHRGWERRRLLRQRMAVRDDPPGPEDIVCDDALGSWLLAQVEQLEGRERQVILARAGGMGTVEAAQQLGISVKSAESAFTRARARLRNAYDRAMEPRGRLATAGRAARP